MTGKISKVAEKKLYDHNSLKIKELEFGDGS